MIKNICFIACFFLSSATYAQVAIDKGEKAPEDGVFYTNLEAAQLIADRKAEREKFQLALDSQRKESEVLCEGEKKVKDLQLKALEEKEKLLLSIKDQQIRNLEEQLKKEIDDYSMWWFAGGATVATVASITIFFAATQIDKAPSIITGN